MVSENQISTSITLNSKKKNNKTEIQNPQCKIMAEIQPYSPSDKKAILGYCQITKESNFPTPQFL
jgi:hypothetical protein